MQMTLLCARELRSKAQWRARKPAVVTCAKAGWSGQRARSREREGAHRVLEICLRRRVLLQEDEQPIDDASLRRVVEELPFLRGEGR